MAALGILNEQRSELEQFLTLGVDEETQRAIGDLPRGDEGCWAPLIDNPQPLRLAEVGQLPVELRVSGGAPGDAQLLGVPIVIRGEVVGQPVT